MTARTRRRWCPKDKGYVLAIEDRPGLASRAIWGFVTLGVSEMLLAFQGRVYLCPACGAVTATREPVGKGCRDRPGWPVSSPRSHAVPAGPAT